MKQIATLILCLWGMIALSNTKKNEQSFIQSSGNITIFNKIDIHIIKEDILIIPAGEFFTIKIEMTLLNNGNNANAQIGFPINYLPSGQFLSYTDYVQSFQYSVNGNILPHNTRTDSLTSTIFKNKDTLQGKVYRIWYQSEITFNKSESKKITIDYKIRANYCDNEHPESYFPQYSVRRFFFDLHPEGVNNNISELNINMKYNNIVMFDNISHNGFDTLYFNMNGQKELYTSIKNFKSSSSKIISINYDYTNYYLKSDFSKSLPNSVVKNVRASSQLNKNYSAKNIIDSDYTTSWAEGVEGGGKDEWIEIEFKEGVLISGVAIISGDPEDYNRYLESSKVKSYEIEIYTKINDSVYIQKFGNNKILPDNNKRTFPMSGLNTSNYYKQMDIVLNSDNPYEYSKDNNKILKKYGTTTKIRFRLLDFYKKERVDKDIDVDNETAVNDETYISEFFFYGIEY